MNAIWDPVVDHSTFMPEAIVDALAIAAQTGTMHQDMPLHEYAMAALHRLTAAARDQL